MRMDDEVPGRFIAGVYNYCDRWCARCRFDDRCRVRAQEQDSRERRLRRGEDPDDTDAVMADVAGFCGEAMAMLQEMAEEEEIDLAALEDELGIQEPPEPHVDPLVRRAERWGDRIESLVDHMCESMPGLAPKLVRQIEESPLGVERAGEMMVSELEAIRECYDVFAHFRYFVVVKTMRAVGSRESCDSHPSLDSAHAKTDDARGTAKLLSACLREVESALWRAAEFHRPWQEVALPLAAETRALRESLSSRFPGYETFHRPGFDDDPSD